MFDNCKNSKSQGQIGVGSAINYYTSIGYTVCIPLLDNQDYDLIVDSGVKLLKVQVKTTKQLTSYGIPIVNLRVCGGNQSYSTSKVFDSSSVDLVYVLCSNGDRYNIPSTEIKAKNSFNLGESYRDFKIKSGAA
jgi:hypothetical protein